MCEILCGILQYAPVDEENMETLPQTLLFDQ